MTNTLQKIIRELKEGDNLELVNEHFSNEIILNESVQCSILGDITFFNVDFRNVDLTGACDFKNCRFNNVMLLKCEFWNSTFENCQMENCNLTRGAFYDSNFKNCNFININLRASDFSNFEFVETKFKNSKLDFIGVRSIKVCKSKQCLILKKF